MILKLLMGSNNSSIWGVANKGIKGIKIILNM